MKHTIKDFIIIITLVILGFLLGYYATKVETSQRIVDLPEEIQIAQKGDTLIVLYNTSDSLSIGFKH